MPKYRKKPVVIEAVQYDGNFRSLDCFSIHEVGKFIVSKTEDNKPCLKIPTSEGLMIATVGDYIIREPFDKERMFYPCKPDIFEKTYEKWGE